MEKRINFKYLITSYQKCNCMGDMYLDGFNEIFFAWQPLIGKYIRVKILGLFWIKYKSFMYNKK